MDDNKPFTPDPLNYDQQQTFFLDRPFVLTQGKTLIKGMPYLYSEGNNSVAVRLFEIWKEFEMEDEFVCLTLQELQSNRCFKVSWNLDYDGDYYLWSLADLPSLMNTTK